MSGKYEKAYEAANEIVSAAFSAGVTTPTAVSEKMEEIIDLINGIEANAYLTAVMATAGIIFLAKARADQMAAAHKDIGEKDLFDIVFRIIQCEKKRYENN